MDAGYIPQIGACAASTTRLYVVGYKTTPRLNGKVFVYDLREATLGDRITAEEIVLESTKIVGGVYFDENEMRGRFMFCIM